MGHNILDKFFLIFYSNPATVLLFFILFLSVYYLSFLKSNRKLPPGPIGLPLLGYWPFLLKDQHLALDKLAKKYGNVFGLYLGRKYAVVLNNFEAVREAFNKTESLYRPPNIFSLVPYGLGFSNANGQEWTNQRRFSVKTMRDIGLGRPQWEELVQEEVDDLVQRVQSSHGQAIDVVDVLGGTFTNNVMTMLFGRRLPYGDLQVRRLTDNMEMLMKQISNMELSNFSPKLSAFLAKIGIWGSKENSDRTQEFSTYIQKCLKEKLEDKNLKEDESFVKYYVDEIDQNKKKNLNNSFTDDSLISNVQTLILGGSETTQNTFLWLLVAMAENQDKQQLVQKELDNVLGKNGAIKYAERAKLPYTFAAILESMRWRTLVSTNPLRMFAEDTTLQGYDIPKGTFIVSNIWALHNDTKYWKDPESFQPERFLKDGGKSFNFKPDSYIPFSLGRRMCPGEIVALTEIFLYFVTFMQKFKVMPREGDTRVKLKTHQALTYQAVGVKLRFIARE